MSAAGRRNASGIGVSGPGRIRLPRSWDLPVRSLFMALVVSCARVEEQPPGVVLQAPAGADQEAWGWQGVVTRSGVRRVVIRAGRFRHYGLSRVDSLDGGVTVEFYGAEGNRASVLNARSGVLDEGSRRVEALGRVRVSASDSTTMETESLRWDDEGGRICGEGAVAIRRPEGTETGIGFEATPDLRRWSMRDVTTRKTR